jgi:formate/nitrite transporter FocA (FNT family)
MLSTVQVYIEATIAIALMVHWDHHGVHRRRRNEVRAFGFGAGLVMIAVSGAVLFIRLWRMTRKPLPCANGAIQVWSAGVVGLVPACGWPTLPKNMYLRSCR